MTLSKQSNQKSIELEIKETKIQLKYTNQIQLTKFQIN